MKLGTIGVGNAGSKIVDKMVEFERRTDRSLCRHVLVVNTARTDLARPDHIADDRRVLIGDTHQQSKGHGAGGDIEAGASIATDDIDEIRRAFDNVEIHEVDAILVAASVGGGTGSGAGPVVINELQQMYDEPVYGLGVLPGEHEGGRPALNAARSLQSFVEMTDNFIAFDNDAWRAKGQSVGQAYDRMNEELAKRVVTLLGAGEVDESAIAENAIDSSDIIRTLDADGISSIGYASTSVDAGSDPGRSGFPGEYDIGHGSTAAAKVNGLVRRATKSRLTLPCEVSSADRALVVLSGPPSGLSRKGLESARQWIEQEVDTVEVLAGDDPRESESTLSAVVLLSNVTETPRIGAIQEVAVDAQDRIAEQDEAREEDIRSLITDEDGELDPVI